MLAATSAAAAAIAAAEAHAFSVPSKPLRHVLTKADNNSAAPQSPNLAPGVTPTAVLTGSPPMSGCSDMSAPDRYFLQSQLSVEASTLGGRRAPGHSLLRPSNMDASPGIDSSAKRAQSFSPDDLDAAAAMLELPSASSAKDASIGGSSGSDGGSSDSASRLKAVPSSGPGLDSSGPVHKAAGAPDFDETFGEGSTETAAELLLAAGRLASVSSQNNPVLAPQSSGPSLQRIATYNAASAAAPAAPAAEYASDPMGPYNPAAADMGAFDSAATDMGAFDPAAAGMGAFDPAAGDMGAAYGYPGTAGGNMTGYVPGYFNPLHVMDPHAAAAVAAAAAMYEMAGRPFGCNCLKPCKPHHPCQLCGSPHSPGHTWRAGPAGPGSLCNACGTRYSRSKQKQMVQAAAAAAIAAGELPCAAQELLWTGSSGGSDAHMDGSGGVGKMMRPKVWRGGRGGGGRGGRSGAPYGVLAALERHGYTPRPASAAGAADEDGAAPAPPAAAAVEKSAADGAAGEAEGQALEGQGSVITEQQWLQQWQAQQQYDQQEREATTEQMRQQQRQQWMAYNQWMQQQQQPDVN